MSDQLVHPELGVKYSGCRIEGGVLFCDADPAFDVVNLDLMIAEYNDGTSQNRPALSRESKDLAGFLMAYGRHQGYSPEAAHEY